MVALLLTGAPDLLTFMPEIAIIGAFGVAALKSLEKEATDNLRAAYTERQLHDTQMKERLEEPSHWWVYSIVLYMASAAAFFAYDALPSEVLSVQPYLQPILSAAAFLFALGSAYFLIIVFLSAFKSEKFLAAAHGIGFGLRVGAGAVALMSAMAFLYLDVFIFVIVVSAIAESGLTNVTLWGLVLTDAAILSTVGGVAILLIAGNFMFRKDSPFDSKREAVSIIAFMSPFVLLIVNTYLEWV